MKKSEQGDSGYNRCGKVSVLRIGPLKLGSSRREYPHLCPACYQKQPAMLTPEQIARWKDMSLDVLTLVEITEGFPRDAGS